jgi:hypothetical protein
MKGEGEHVEHESVGEVEVVKDDVKEDVETILEEREVIETGLTD